MKRHFMYAGLALALLVAPACSTVANLATSLSSSSVAQVNTLGDALQAATLVTRAVDLYVTTGHPDRGTLVELKALNEGLHTSLMDLQAANTRGQSLNFAAFNAALDAYNAYATLKGVGK